MFRILNQFPVYFGNDGRPAENGRLRFFDAGTMTPREVYDGPGGVSLGSTILLGADGRATEDAWGDGRYYVRLEASDDTLIAEADNVEVAGGEATAIPSLVADQFLTNDGSVMSWAPILQVPDPTGQSGKILGTDGVTVGWIPEPEAPIVPPADIDSSTDGTSGSFRAGTHFEQWGRGSCPATGGDHATVDVSFPEAFVELYGVTLQVTVGTVNGVAGVATGVTNETTAGFRAEFDIADRHFYQSHITAPIPFFWRAIGKTTVPTP